MGNQNLITSAIHITEATANVNYILSVVQMKWVAEYIIVTEDGPQLKGSEVKQQSTFSHMSHQFEQ